MAVIGEPRLKRLKLSSSSGIRERVKAKMKDRPHLFSFAEQTQNRNDCSLQGYVKLLNGNVARAEKLRDENLPDIIEISSSDEDSDGGSSSCNGCRERNVLYNDKFYSNFSKDSGVKVKANSDSRHFMDFLAGKNNACQQGVFEKNRSDLEKTDHSHFQGRRDSSSSLDFGSTCRSSFDSDVVTCHGRLIVRKYINYLPVLFVPGFHSFLKFRYVSASSSPFDRAAAAAVESVVYSVRPLQKAFHRLYDALHEDELEFSFCSCLSQMERWLNVGIEPSKHIKDSVMKRLLCSRQVRSSLSCYTFLMRTLHLFPATDGMPFSMYDLENALDELDKAVVSWNSTVDKLPVINMVLRLIYQVSCLENELLNAELTSKQDIMVSSVSMWISADKKFTFVKRIIHLLFDFLKYSESVKCSSVSENDVWKSPSLISDDLDHGLISRMMSKVLLLYQHLLTASQSVSSYPLLTADRISTELVTEYSRVDTLSHRYMVLESISSPLIKLKFSQRILEKRYQVSLKKPMFSVPSGCVLEDLFQVCADLESCRDTTEESLSKFSCLLEDTRKHLILKDIEEFCVLLYTTVQSYLRAKIRDVSCPLWDRAMQKKDATASVSSYLSSSDTVMLQRLPNHAERLRVCFCKALGTGATPTRRTLVSLKKLACLSDLCLSHEAEPLC